MLKFLTSTIPPLLNHYISLPFSNKLYDRFIHFTFNYLLYILTHSVMIFFTQSNETFLAMIPKNHILLIIKSSNTYFLNRCFQSVNWFSYLYYCCSFNWYLWQALLQKYLSLFSQYIIHFCTTVRGFFADLNRQHHSSQFFPSLSSVRPVLFFSFLFPRTNLSFLYFILCLFFIIILLWLFQFSPLCPSPPHSYWQSPHCCPGPWVHSYMLFD